MHHYQLGYFLYNKLYLYCLSLELDDLDFPQTLVHLESDVVLAEMQDLILAINFTEAKDSGIYHRFILMPQF